jgi:transcriptional regulator with GAF, ATPase, and Fis domain
VTPKLVSIAGPSKGSSFPISVESFAIGREASNSLALEDASVSRWHAGVRYTGEECTLKDLNSRNGTFVNGVPVRERVLENGDEIRIGRSVFLFVLSDYTALEPQAQPDVKDARTSSFMLRPEDSLFLKPAELANAVASDSRVATDLNALLRVTREITSVREVSELRSKLVSLVLEVIPATDAVLILTDDEPAASQLNSVAREALQTGTSVLSKGTFSYLAVPLAALDHRQGAIAAAGHRFDEGHLQLLTAIGSMAALCFQNALHLCWLQGENTRLRAEIISEHNMVGESPKIREVLRIVGKAAPSGATILIRGESGTGKELVARAVHSNSSRAAKPFIAINCATLSEALLESDLFGHEKGAFTGAIAQKRGKIELAEGGTLFLDEIGELAPLLQAKLLRVLQEREYERVGGTKTLKTDIRLIAATNRDLEAAVRESSFRQDLYYRLNVVTIPLPALRERREDIGLLASYFAAKYAAKTQRRIAGISPEARLHLNAYDWPGNVRELENAMERAVVLGSSELILPEDLPENILEAETFGGTGNPAGYHEGVKMAKTTLILNAIEQAGGSHAEAARLLGLHPTYLSRLIRNLRPVP